MSDFARGLRPSQVNEKPGRILVNICLERLEWSLGYTKRFAIVHVNFETQERALSDSAVLFGEIIASNALACAEAGAGSAAEFRRAKPS